MIKPAGTNSAAADQLELAKTQLALDQDELPDAQQDLARQGGDQRANLERALQVHETAQPPKPATPPPTGTLNEQVWVWLSLGERMRQVDSPGDKPPPTPLRWRESITRWRPWRRTSRCPRPVQLRRFPTTPPHPRFADADQEDTATMLARLQHLSDQKKSLSRSRQACSGPQQLAETYAKLNSVNETRQRGALHLLFNSLTAVLAILLATVLLDGVIRRAFLRHAQPRRVHLRVMSTITVQLIAFFAIVLVIVGPPSQLSTIIGLATAGLTIVLRDFLVAFFGCSF